MPELYHMAEFPKCLNCRKTIVLRSSFCSQPCYFEYSQREFERETFTSKKHNSRACNINSLLNTINNEFN